jgi:hypothetical protein
MSSEREWKESKRENGRKQKREIEIETGSAMD